MQHRLYYLTAHRFPQSSFKNKKRAKKSVTIPSHAFSFSAAQEETAHFKSRAPKSLLSFSVLRCAKQIHRDSVFLFRFNTMCEFQIICFQSYRNICSCSTKCRKQNPQEKGLVCQGVRAACVCVDACVGDCACESLCVCF